MDELEDLLRRYQPAGPPPDLGDRIADAVRYGRPRTWREWLPAAAAAAAIVVFYTMSSGLWTEIARTIGVNEAHDAAVNSLAQSLGGSDFARAEAERIVQAAELASRVETNRPAPSDEGVPPND